jgi:hypothetical protein
VMTDGVSCNQVPNGGACANKFDDEMDFPADETLSGPDWNSIRALAQHDVRVSSNS